MSVIGGRGRVYAPTKPTQPHSTVVLYEIENKLNSLRNQLAISKANRDWSPACAMQRPQDYEQDKRKASVEVTDFTKRIAKLEKKRNKVVARQRFVDSIEGVFYRIVHLFS